ncbi:MAG: hypothetical protein ACI4UM_04585 [Succinivibrio sp.]
MKRVINNSRFRVFFNLEGSIYVADSLEIDGDSVEARSFDPDSGKYETFYIALDAFIPCEIASDDDLMSIIELSDLEHLLKFCNPEQTSEELCMYKFPIVPVSFSEKTFLNVLSKLRSCSDEVIFGYSIAMSAFLYSGIIKIDKEEFPRFVPTGTDIVKASLSSLAYTAIKGSYQEQYYEIRSFFEKAYVSEKHTLEDYLKSLWQLEFFIDRVLEENAVGSLSDEEQELFVRGVDYISHTPESRMYLEVTEYLAYAYYGGDSLHSCDFSMSEKYLQILVDNCSLDTPVYKAALYLNSLGYISYYGRVSGKTNIALSKEYFTKAALLGNHEAKLKLHDIYYAQKNDPVSSVVAVKLFAEVIDENRVEFILGDMKTTLADALLRKGALYEDQCSKDCQFDDMTLNDSAFFYYLTGFMVLKKRMKAWPDKYGDDAVFQKYTAALNRTLSKSHFKIPVDVYHFNSKRLALMLKMNTELNIPLKLKLNYVSKKIKTVSIGFPNSNTKKKLIVSVPEGWYSDLVDTLVLDVENCYSFDTSFKDETIIFDSFDGDYFYLEGNRVGHLRAELSFKIPKKQQFLTKKRKKEKKSDIKPDC